MVTLRDVAFASMILYAGVIVGLFIAHKAQDARQKMQQNTISEEEVKDLIDWADRASVDFSLNRKAWPEVLEEFNKPVGKHCDSFNKLSPREQVLRINEILGTPNPQPLGSE